MEKVRKLLFNNDKRKEKIYKTERNNRYVDVDRSYLSRGIHTITVSGGELMYFVHADIEPGAVIPVFFHAAIDRRKIELPRFEGLGLCKKNQWAGISFADPVLLMYEKCSLAWFVGNDRYNKLQREIHNFLETISEKWNITFVFHGGSGGGFAALIQKSLFPNQHFAVVQNPQTDIRDFSRQHLINYFLTYEKQREETEYQSVLEQYGFLYRIKSAQVTDVLYFQNRSDSLHVEKHLKPFIGENYSISYGFVQQKKRNNYYFVGDWGEGHATLPGEIVERVLQRVIEFKSFDGISQYIIGEEPLKLLNRDQYEALLEEKV